MPRSRLTEATASASQWRFVHPEITASMPAWRVLPWVMQRPCYTGPYRMFWIILFAISWWVFATFDIKLAASSNRCFICWSRSISCC